MTTRLVWDLESKFLFSEIGGRDNTHKLGVACAVVYDYSTNCFETYDNNEVELLKARLEAADELVGFCSEKFDGPVTYALANSQPPKQLLGKTNDLYRRICVAAGKNPNAGNRGFGLGALCEATLGRTKVENGKDAPQMWRDGQWGRLLRYCISDVALCRDLNDFINNEGYVVGPRNQRIEVPKWQPSIRPLPPAAGLTSGLL